MIQFILIALLEVGSLRGSFAIKQNCDMMELNHFYDGKCKHIYDQVIYWRRKPENGKYEVRAWALVEDRESIRNRPIKNVNSGLWESYYKRSGDDYYILITSPIFKESWTQKDPEREDKKNLPENLRLDFYNKRRLEEIIKKEEEIENGKQE